MNQILREFVADTTGRSGKRLRSSGKYSGQAVEADQALDAAMIGGYGLRDILSGQVRESDISPIVIKAFHLQYPHAGGFIAFIREHKGDSALLGIINGIKGKAFELEYLEFLNHGHLPHGAYAELAHSPTQEGWDIAVRDAHGHVLRQLQLKATQSLPETRATRAASHHHA